jgi:serine/threonine-protein kinase
MGKDFWGTKRLKSPEEYVYGAVIDEATNIFTLGALLFHFFGSYSENDITQMYKNNSFFPCSLEKWELSKEMYEVSLRAVNTDRNKRYNSMSDFSSAWNKALDI